MDAERSIKTTQNTSGAMVAMGGAEPPSQTSASDDAELNLAQQLINAPKTAKVVAADQDTKAAKTSRRKPAVSGKKSGTADADTGARRQDAPKRPDTAPPALPLESAQDKSPADAQENSSAGAGAQALARQLIQALEACQKPTTESVESWQPAWEASCPVPEDHTRLLLASVGTALAAVLCWGGVSCGATLVGKATGFDKAPAMTAAVTQGTLRAAYLDDVRAGQEQLAGFWSPTLEVSAMPAQPVPPSPGKMKPTMRHARALTVDQTASTAALLSATPSPTIDPEFAQFHGSASRYRASTKRSGGATPAASAPAPGTKPSALGQMLHASLSNQLASNSTGTMAKAVLTRRMTIGEHLLPAGAELTGTITGGDDTRVFVDFTSVRLDDGQVLQMSGKAADNKGRYGLPGRREISRRSVASVGIASSNSMLVEAGQQVGGSIGGIIGRGIAAATSSAADKASRADRDEYVVLVDRGAMFTVLVERID